VAPVARVAWVSERTVAVAPARSVEKKGRARRAERLGR
jgi:hypothetical protein